MDPANPYESPSIDAQPPPAPTLTAANPAAVKMMRTFRVQIRALGLAWIVMGSIAVAVAMVFLLPAARPQPETFVLLTVLAALGLAWLIMGILAWRQQIGAVYVGLVVLYLALLPSFCVSLWLTVGLFASILQAHGVLAWARAIRRMGIPLTTSPEELPAQRRTIDVSQWQ